MGVAVGGRWEKELEQTKRKQKDNCMNNWCMKGERDVQIELLIKVDDKYRRGRGKIDEMVDG